MRYAAALVGFAFGTAWAAVELAVAGYDWLVARDPDEELREFLATHPNVTVYNLEEH